MRGTAALTDPPSVDSASLARVPLRMRVAALTILLVVVGLWTVVTVMTIGGRDRTLDRARSHTGNLARLLEEHSYRTLRSADALARGIASAIERGTPPESIALQIPEPGPGQAIQRITWLDAGGIVRWSTELPVGTDFSRAPALELARAARGRAAIGASRPGPRPGKFMFPLVRAINGPDGRVAGAVVVSLDPDFFTGLYAEIDLGTKGAVSLAHAGDGSVLARRYGGDFQLPAAGKHYDPMVIPAGTTVYAIRPGAIDGEERVYAYRDVPEFGVRVNVGLATSEVLEPVRERAVLAFTLVAIVTITLLISRRGMLREARRLAIAHRAAEEARIAGDRARAEAESASAAKSAFLAHMSHEIRTPLAAILGTADAVLADPRPEKLPGRIEAVRRTALTLKQLLDDVLDLSRMEARPEPVDTRPFRPDALLADVLAPYRSVAEAKGITIDVEDERLPTWVAGDAPRLRQVLFNLVGNAVKFTEQGGITVRAAFSHETGRLAFTVTDTGVGLSSTAIEHLFEPFCPPTAAPAGTDCGSGLGLAICHRLVAAMGGTLRADTTRTRGASFSFDVPVCEVAPPSGAAVLPAVAREAANGRRLRVLLAEDHPLIADVERTMLEREGFEVETASDGAAAVAMAQSTPFDAVLMDLRMPGLDGHAAARAIRAGGGALARLPIIALTADPLENDAAGRDRDFDATCLKPADWPTLRALIEQLVARRAITGRIAESA